MAGQAQARFTGNGKSIGVKPGWESPLGAGNVKTNHTLAFVACSQPGRADGFLRTLHTHGADNQAAGQGASCQTTCQGFHDGFPRQAKRFQQQGCHAELGQHAAVQPRIFSRFKRHALAGLRGRHGRNRQGKTLQVALQTA